MKTQKLFLFGALAILLFASVAVPPVKACWNTYLIECFSDNFNTWPWTQHPPGSGRAWRCFPTRQPNGQDTWGIQEIVYSTQYQFLCSDDIQSVWCIGGPGTHDPDFDNYQANLNTYMTYGPIDLTNATEAQVQFSLFMHNNMDTGDSLFWGADSVFSLALTHVWTDTSYRTNTPAGWTTINMDLKDLYRQNGDSVSALGRPVVYVFWWFKANSNAIRGRGAFVDDVVVQWDDGLLDLTADGIAVYYAEDSTDIYDPVHVGDSLISRVTWRACDGSVDSYPPYRLTVTQNTETLVDTLISDFVPDSAYSLYTPVWVVPAEGDYEIVLHVDALGEIAEGNENNNIQNEGYSAVPPNVLPQFVWTNPGDDTVVVNLETNNMAMLRWTANDPDNQATVSIYYDQNTDGCFGPSVPGGLERPEMDGPDSLSWNLAVFPNGSVLWPFAIVYDDDFDTCIYASFPVHINRTTSAIGDEQEIPQEFFLSQNYPNPFNPATDIFFGIHTPGHVTLRVFDLLGRESAVLINQEMAPGTHHAIFDARELPSGVYVYTLSSPEGIQSKKMILMK